MCHITYITDNNYHRSISTSRTLVSWLKVCCLFDRSTIPSSSSCGLSRSLYYAIAQFFMPKYYWQKPDADSIKWHAKSKNVLWQHMNWLQQWLVIETPFDETRLGCLFSWGWGWDLHTHSGLPYNFRAQATGGNETNFRICFTGRKCSLFIRSWNGDGMVNLSNSRTQTYRNVTYSASQTTVTCSPS